MVKSAKDWINIDYLELFCQTNQMVVGCKAGDEEEEVWISALGPHPSHLTADEIQNILKQSASFELRNLLADDDQFEDTYIVTRNELQQRLRRLLN